jgi:DNA-binding phage protein
MTLKAEIAALLKSSDVGTRGLIIDDNGIIELLKGAIEREGSISAFARRHGLTRSQLTSILNRKRPVSSPLVKALGLRKVYTPNV